jgi:hypothetical protein
MCRLLVAFSSSAISMKLLDWMQEQVTQSLLTPQFIFILSDDERESTPGASEQLKFLCACTK